MDERLPFWRLKKDGTPKKSMVDSRRLIVTLLRNQKRMSRLSLVRETGVNPRIASDMLKLFVRQGLVMPVVTLKTEHQTNFAYELTDEGKLVALALSVEEKEIVGLDYAAYMQDMLEHWLEKEKTAPKQFSYGVYLRMVKRGRVGYVLSTFKHLVEAAYHSGDTDPLSIQNIPKSLSAPPSDAEDLRTSILEIHSALSEEDRLTMNLTFKALVARELFMGAMKSEDTRVMEQVKDIFGEPTYVYLPFKCPVCGYAELKRKVHMTEVITSTFTGRTLKCRRCRQDKPLKEAVEEKLKPSEPKALESKPTLMQENQQSATVQKS